MLAMVKSSTHNNDILFRRIGVAEDMTQVVEITRIAHCDQNIPRPHAHGSTAELLVAVNPELVELLRLTLAFTSRTPFRIGKNEKKHNAKAYARDRRLILRKKVHDCRRKQDEEDCDDSQGNFFPCNSQVPGHLPLAMLRFGVTEHQDGQRIQSEAPDDAEGV